MFCTETFRLLLFCGYNSDTCVRVLHRPDVFLHVYVSLPTIQVSSSWGMTNCSTDRRSRRSARTSGGNSRPGIRRGGSRAACTNWRRAVGRNWCRRSLRVSRWGVNPRTPHAPCMAWMSRVHGQGRLWDSITASGITSGLSNTGSSTECGVPAYLPVATNSATSRVVGSARDRCRST